MYHDAHNHLQDPALAPHLDEIAAAYAEIGLERAVVNGTCEADWPDVTALARRYQFVLPSHGLHPWDAGNRTPNWFDTLRATLDANPGAHIGEIGLDRWIIDRARPDDPRLAGLRRAPLDEQAEVFRAQLALAAERNLAASIHCLDAFGLLLKILETTPLPVRGFLLHAYSGPVEMLPQFIKLGAYFSFNGSFLSEKNTRHREVFRQIPVERILVETDAPAMPAPAKYRPFSFSAPDDKLNHPANIADTHAGLAGAREVGPAALGVSLAQNFARLFGG
ncbi:TatD DNase family protein [Ereboglobus sp. PH5-5]|uniref:TatD family hydrolase n=1 Tax=Ereboglobus sp. PH5-5 TaxID=2940529 RepID=UPI002404C883|nr:TatD family hydrolase [Ereboglobus sp. PH5-5]MDF9833991.1 TatD DNase family protein [Ereboglobus sp. PH5-5]